MKNLITILCLLCFAGCAFAEVYQVPGSLVESYTELPAEKQVGDKKIKKKKLRRRKDYNPTNSYWNFGRPPFWTGSI